MAFIILGSVGSALASGLAAVGLGTVGAAGAGAAAGTGLAGAIGSAAGAATGIGTGIASGIGTGLMALGVPGAVGAGGTVGGMAGTLGTGIASAAGGAGLGSATSAAMGGDPGTGALLGAVGGGLTSGLGGALGGASSGAGSAVGEAAKTAGLSSEALAGAVPASSGVGVTSGAVTAPTTAGGMSSAAIPTGSSAFGGFGGELGKMALKEGVGMMMPQEQQAAPPMGGGGGRPKSPYDQDRGPTFSLANSPFRFAEGGLTTLKGGGIMMREGQYVIPADVVSAIGNGSSKAGAKFLEQAFNYYIQNGPPEGVKPEPRAGNLAEQRMMERIQRQAG